MKGCKEEAEVIVRLDYKEGLAHICVSAWPGMFRKMTKRYGVSLDGPDPKRAARWKVPLRAVMFKSSESLSRKPP